MDQKIGSWAFIIGVVIAIIAGLLGTSVFAGAASWIPVLFIVLGVIIGFLNISDKEAQHFLVAVIALLAASGVNWGVVPAIGTYLGDIFLNIAALMAPAGIIVGLKSVWSMASSM